MLSQRLIHLVLGLEEIAAREEPLAPDGLRLLCATLEECAAGAMALEACVVPAFARASAGEPQGTGGNVVPLRSAAPGNPTRGGAA